MHNRKDLFFYPKEFDEENFTAFVSYQKGSCIRASSEKLQIISKFRWLIEFFKKTIGLSSDKISNTVIHANQMKWLYIAAKRGFFQKSKMQTLETLSIQNPKMEAFVKKVILLAKENEGDHAKNIEKEISSFFEENKTKLHRSKKKHEILPPSNTLSFFGESHLQQIEVMMAQTTLSKKELQKIPILYENALFLSKTKEQQEKIILHFNSLRFLFPKKVNVISQLKPKFTSFSPLYEQNDKKVSPTVSPKEARKASSSFSPLVEELIQTEKNVFKDALFLFCLLFGEQEQVLTYLKELNLQKEELNNYFNPTLHEFFSKEKTLLELKEPLLLFLHQTKQNIDVFSKQENFVNHLKNQFSSYCKNIVLFEFSHSFFFSFIEQHLNWISKTAGNLLDPIEKTKKFIGGDVLTFQPLFARPGRIIDLIKKIKSDLDEQELIIFLESSKKEANDFLRKKQIEDIKEKIFSSLGQISSLEKIFFELAGDDIPSFVSQALEVFSTKKEKEQLEVFLTNGIQNAQKVKFGMRKMKNPSSFEYRSMTKRQRIAGQLLLKIQG